MNKQDFLLRLKNGLSGLPQDEIEERISFYSEMIDDRMEEGLSEEEAVADIGSDDKIISQIIADTPITKLVKEKIQPKRKLAVWEIILLVLGSPIWLSLLIALIAIILSVYVTLWTVIIALWATFAGLAAGALCGIAAGLAFILRGSVLTGIAFISTGFVCAGLSIFMFFGCRAATKGIICLTGKLTLWIKKCFVRKEAA